MYVSIQKKQTLARVRSIVDYILLSGLKGNNIVDYFLFSLGLKGNNFAHVLKGNTLVHVLNEHKRWHHNKHKACLIHNTRRQITE
jgi:hypothetical protein